MSSMLSESVEEREEKLFEGAKKIESSELSNQKEADILDSHKVSQCMGGGQEEQTDLVQVAAVNQSHLRP
jgi:hypothetical protein